MADINVQLNLSLDCPIVNMIDGTDYSNVDEKYERQYVDYAHIKIVEFVGSEIIYFSEVDPDKVLISDPTSVDEDYISSIDGPILIELTLVHRAVIFEAAGNEYVTGDCVYHNGVLYKCLAASHYLTDFDELLDTDLFEVITHDDIPQKYRDTEYISVRCHAFKCIRTKMNKAVCAIEDHLNNDQMLCKDKRFIEAIRGFVPFYEFYYGVTTVTSDNLNQQKNVANLMNKKCCGC